MNTQYWMNNADAYMTDGSYSYAPCLSKGSKIYYSVPGNEHSGIITDRKIGPIGPEGYDVVTVESKWGQGGLMRHKALDCPYYFEDTLQFLDAYKR